MTKLAAKIQTKLAAQQDKGATAVEYGLLVALIAAVIVGVVATLGTADPGRASRRSSTLCRDRRCFGRGPSMGPRPEHDFPVIHTIRVGEGREASKNA